MDKLRQAEIFLREQLPEGGRVLCAVSGGLDSMCLLHLLKSAGIEVAAAHFEHGIRGEESLRDLNFVRDFCAENNIPFVFESVHFFRYDVSRFAYAPLKKFGMFKYGGANFL